MINEIIDGICLALNAEFGDECEIYTETLKQGLKEPCFSIVCINPTQEQFLGDRYYKTNCFCVHYFPCSSETNAEINTVRERLFNTLEYITVDGDLIRGTKMTAEIDDLGVLTFIVNYDLFVKKVDGTATAMEDYDYQNNVKG